MRHRGWLRTILLTGAASLALVAPASAEPRDFNVPAGDLAQALDAYARQSGDQIIFSSDLVRGGTTAGVAGRLEPEAALARILDGTGLQVRRGPSGAVIVADRAEANQLEEVVVTAQRRDERLMDVPVSVTALSGAELERAQVPDIRTLANVAPSLVVVTSSNSPNDLIMGLRGVIVSTTNTNVDPTVGVYVDGVYYARTAGANAALQDLERVEVLRGPQGTLFGRNTIGGALNVTTRKPENGFGGLIKAGIGNYDTRQATAMLNLPLVPDKLAARFYYDHFEHDGYGRSSVLDLGLSNENREFVRGTVKINPTSNFEAVISADHFESRRNGQLWVLDYFDPAIAPAAKPAALGAFLAPGSRTNTANFNAPNSDKASDVTATMTAGLGGATLKSITAYRTMSEVVATDLDGSALSVQHARTNFDADQFTQELQAYGEALDGRLDWIVGGYYFIEEARSLSLIDAFPGTALIDRRIGVENISKSVFGQLTLEVLPGLSLVGGARYVEDTRKADYSTGRTTVPGGVASCTLPAGLNQRPGACFFRAPSVKFDYVPWTLGVNYKPNDDTLIYAKATKGYRSGGLQPPGATQPGGYLPFGPENTLSYEVGAKFDLLDKRLRVTAAGYRSTYARIQQNQITPGPPVIITVVNAGEARIWGGELDVTALLGDLRLTGSLGWIDPRYTKGPLVDSPYVTNTKTTVSLSADYPIRLSNSEILLHADYSWRSSQFYYSPFDLASNRFLNAAQIASFTQEGYGVLNGMVSWTLEDPAVTFTLWGKNLTNKYYSLHTLSTYASGYSTFEPADPRTYGVSVAYRF